MSRYLVGALLGLIAVLTLYGVGSSQNVWQQIGRGTRASRESISAIPASAANGAPSIDQAGQNVVRQTSLDGIQQAQNTTPPETQTAQGQSTTPETSTAAEGTAPQPQPASPAAATAPSTPQTNPDAIPALW